MIYEVPNFIDGELCNDLIKYHDDSNNVKRKMEHPIFNNRVICPSEIRDPDIAFRMRIFEHKVTQIASKLFYKEPFLFIEHWDVVHWEPGMSMEAHVDNGEFTYDHHDDYTLSNRHYTGVCYLNDGYDGGETFFPTEQKVCTPKKGKFVVFPSDLQHGVKEVFDHRYTLGVWFTRNENAIHGGMYA